LWVSDLPPERLVSAAYEAALLHELRTLLHIDPARPLCLHLPPRRHHRTQVGVVYTEPEQAAALRARFTQQFRGPTVGAGMPRPCVAGTAPSLSVFDTSRRERADPVQPSKEDSEPAQNKVMALSGDSLALLSAKIDHLVTALTAANVSSPGRSASAVHLRGDARSRPGGTKRRHSRGGKRSEDRHKLQKT
jgi:hypothetical protein